MNKLIAVLAVLVVGFGSVSPAVAGDKDTVNTVVTSKTLVIYACDTEDKLWASESPEPV